MRQNAHKLLQELGGSWLFIYCLLVYGWLRVQHGILKGNACNVYLPFVAIDEYKKENSNTSKDLDSSCSAYM